MMRDIWLTVLMWVLGGLFAVVGALLVFLGKAYRNRGDERYTTLATEVASLRTRLHALEPRVGKIDQWQRFYDKDKSQ